MKRADFAVLPNFKPREVTRLGDKLEDVSFTLMLVLQGLRRDLGEIDPKARVYITCLGMGKHAPKSYHYKDNTESGQIEAVDFKVRSRVPKNTVYQIMLDNGFIGIGIYHGFWHGDIRLKYKVWKRVRGIYYPLV